MSKERKGRSLAYSEIEVDVLLDLVESILPMGHEQWDKVAVGFREKFTQTNRDTESLRCKFKALKNSKKPTGDPSCPPMA